jgi:hypothetical protein
LYSPTESMSVLSGLIFSVGNGLGVAVPKLSHSKAKLETRRSHVRFEG